MEAPQITPFLIFTDDAEEAVKFYVSIFPDAAIDSVSRFTHEGPGPAGTVVTVSFHLQGQQFTALSGGPQFQFTEAVSFVVNCDTQEEIDHFWSKLGESGEEQQCGWLKDKYGLSWQIVPRVLEQLMGDEDAARAGRVTQAMLQMVKLDIAQLQAAYDGV